MMTDYRGQNIARGIRLNNPGNIVKTSIKWKGKVHSSDRRFEEFESIEYGIRAMMRNIITKFHKGYNSIESLINEWAPAFENNTKAYIFRVSTSVGISPSKPIERVSKELLISLAKAISGVENGKDAKLIAESSYNQAYDMIGYDVTAHRFSNKKPKKKSSEMIIPIAVLGVTGIVLLFGFGNTKRYEDN